MERALYFDKFRNIGLEGHERLVLNHSLEKGKMGNLVILVGTNNSGKSNVLAGLTAFGNRKISQRDITMLSYATEDRNPSLSMSLKDDNGEDYTVRIYADGKEEYFCPKRNVKTEEYTFANDIDVLKEDLTYIVRQMSNYNLNGSYTKTHEDTQLFVNLVTYLGQADHEKQEIIDKVISTLDNSFARHPNQTNWWTNFVKARPMSALRNEYTYAGWKNSLIKVVTEAIRKFGVDVIPQIINYAEEPIKNTDLSCDVASFSKNKFLNALFEKVGISKEEINNTYDAFRKNNNKGALTVLEKRINGKLKAVSEDFNRMYFVDENRYSFGISLESNMIYFSMFRGENDIILDYQSTGFRWFFNLYFNLLAKSTLKPGDILIMDEPATNLHVLGQIELRKFLKDFAMKNDLTIVIATHSPFLIDLDYLDELRVVSMTDNKSSIRNDFSTIDSNDPDALKPVKAALTVNNHVLLDPDKKVVFVEGITDYNYLTAFNKKLRVADDVVFLPIQGIGNVKNGNIKEHQIKLSKALIKIRKSNPVLLVDADRAGESMKSVNQKDSALTVVSLSDIDPAIKQIEHLFDIKDRKALGLVDDDGKPVKRFGLSANIKTYIDDYDFEETTLNNFRKVIEYLID